MTRTEWQQLAGVRLDDAEALLDAGRWSAAYYLVGYAVECGLKACVLALVAGRPEIIFRDRKFSERCWTHDLEALVAAADLKAARDADATANPALGANWQIVKDWSEKDRYQQWSEPQARRLYAAVAGGAAGAGDGVLPWIKNHW